jgi:hypothetical protein
VWEAPVIRFSFLLFAIAGLVGAQSHPNFSGTWKLNVAESDFNDKRAVVPDRLVLTIQHKNDKLKFKNEWQKADKKNTFDVDLTIGGPPYESNAAGVVTAERKGDSLVVSTLYNPGTERQSDQVQTWNLSADGKKLIEEMIVHPPGNRPEVRIKRVFEKQ